MSTLKTANIQDTSGSNNSTPEQINQGRAKAWITFDGTAGTVSASDSYNFSSITDDGVGTYTLNFTTPFSNTNYCKHGGTFAAGNGFYHWYDNQSTTSVQLGFIHSGGSYVDVAHVSCVILFGD